MMRNFWYAVSPSAALTDKPRAVRLLGRNIVIYRTADGRPAALRDRCCHRGDRLSRGSVEGECLRCPYHGWAYDPDGLCVDIPSLEDQSRIPKRAQVEAFDAIDHNGWVHVFVGELPLDERPPLLEVPELSEPGWRLTDFEYSLDAHYTRVVENAVDISHLPFLHRDTYGPEQPIRPPMQHGEQGEWSGRGSYDHATRAPSPLSWVLWKPIPANSTFIWHLPCFTVTRAVSDMGSLVLVMCHLPVDGGHTRILYRLARNFATASVFDGIFEDTAMAVFVEDRASVEEQRPRIAPAPAAEVHVPADTLPLGFRKARREILARGWTIEDEE